MFFVSKGSLLDFYFTYFTAAGVKCRVAAVKRLPVLHHSADHIFISFGITEAILVALKTKYLLPVPKGGCSFANYIATHEEA